MAGTPGPRPVGRRRAARTLAEQAAAQVQPPFPARPGHPDLVSYALRDAAHALLHAVGAHPGLTAADLAVACDAPVRHVRRRLRVCSAQALVTSWIVDPSAGRRYGLTARGLRVLAARSAVPPGLYARVHGLLDDKAADRNDTGHLARLRRHAAHTAAVNAVYLAVLTAARAAGGSLVRRGEWVCRHEYQFPALGSPGGWGADPEAPCVRHGTLYPDAEMLYGGPAPARRRRYYIEVDRDTEGLTGARGLEAKFTRYLDYRRDRARRAERPRPVTILFVTTTARRAAAALALSERLAIERREAPLDLHVTTLAALERAEARQLIWQDLSGVPHALDGAAFG